MVNEKQTTDKKKANHQSLKFQRDKDRELVEGIFKFYEVPGGKLTFVFKKYKGDPIERYTMVDGQRYKIPLGVAKHLNTNGAYPVHAYKLNEKGLPQISIGKMVRRFGFQSLEFIDPRDLPDPSPEIITVENIF